MPQTAALLRMIRHIPAEQLAWRALYGAKRAARLRLARAGFATPLAAGTDATALPVALWPRPSTPIVHPHAGATVDLHGLALPLAPPIAWTAEDGFPGTDLQLVALHEHRWIAALPDDALVDVVSDWIARVRPYGPRYWVAAWNGYTLAGRALAWMRELAARDLPPGFVARALASLREQIAFLYRNLEHDLRGNHLLRDLAALAWASACFEGPGADAWRARVVALLPAELDHQILPDGLHFERSPTYHLQVFADLLTLHQALPDGSVRDQLRSALDRMASAAAWLAHPDGGPSLFSDGGLAVAPTTGDLLAAWAAGAGAPVARPVGAHLFAHAGYAVHRGDREVLIVDVGRLGADDLPAHGHADALAIEWSIDGRRVFVDAGTPCYAAGPLRAASRGTAAHNTVTLDGADQGELFGSFRLGRRPSVARTSWEPAPDGLVVAAHHDGYAHLPGRPIHHRRVARSGDRLHIVDRIEGGRGQRAVARLLLHPGVAATARDGAVVLRVGRRALTLRTSGAVHVEDAVWWPDFGEEIPTRRVVIDYGAAPCAGSVTIEVGRGR